MSRSNLTAKTPDEVTKLKWKRNMWKSDVTRAIITDNPEIITLTSTDKNKKRKAASTVHLELLCHFSGYYRTQLEGSSDGAKKKTFEIDVSNEILDLFVGWLYTGTLGEQAKFDDIALDLYILGDRLDILALRRSVMTYLHVNDYSIGLAHFVTISNAFDALPDASQYLRYQIENHGEHWDPDFHQEHVDYSVEGEKAHPKFLYGVMTYQARRRIRGTKMPCDCCHDLCSYHEHESEEERLATCDAVKQEE